MTSTNAPGFIKSEVIEIQIATLIKQIFVLWICFNGWVSPENFNKQKKEPLELFYKKRCSQKFHKIHRKTPVPESLF